MGKKRKKGRFLVHTLMQRRVSVLSVIQQHLCILLKNLSILQKKIEKIKLQNKMPINIKQTAQRWTIN